MQTRCPECQTSFRVTPEQLKARAGKVRCGHCQAVFNALDSLVDASPPASIVANEPAVTHPEPSPTLPPVEIHFLPVDETPRAQPNPAVVADEFPRGLSVSSGEATDLRQEPSALDFPEPPTASLTEGPAHRHAEPTTDTAARQSIETEEDATKLSPSEAKALGKATGLILPRETTEIPGYSKWSEGVMTNPISLPQEKPSRWPFALATGVLVLALAGQLAFYFRGEIAALWPSLRPLIESISRSAGRELPLPRHIAQISIETSDLQNDASRGNLLVLNATLRNRAPYPQEFPALELALTDTRDSALLRKVFLPAEYLPGGVPANAQFPAAADVAIRLWLEARDVDAAGYRLYVFYP